MSVIHTERERSIRGREVLLPLGIGLSLVVFFFRLWYLQVVQAAELQERGKAFQQVVAKKEAPRGQIVDRNGKLLAGVHSELVLTAQPGTVRKSPEILRYVSSFLNVPFGKLQRKVEDEFWRPFLPTPIYNGLPIDVAIKIAESKEHFPGFGVECQPIRYYTDPCTFAHVLGYVSAPNKKDVERIQEAGFQPQRYVGKTGIESSYELDLMGISGQEHLDVDVRRRPLHTHGKDQAIPGKKLILGLDAGLQQLATEKLKGYRGAVVAIEPATGEVLCLVSSPNFDSSKFIHGISSSDWKSLLEDEKKPMLNRAVSARYAPGSAFKVVTSLAAMRKGMLDANYTVHCTGARKIGNRYFRCLGVHGTVDSKRAFTKSCNAYFGELAVRIGMDALQETYQDLLLDQKTGIDIAGEAKGVVPTKDWIQKNRKPPVWYIGDTYNIANGQGEVALTPLQMASIASLVANRGVMYQPHILRKDPSEVKPIAKLALSAANWDTLHEMMAEVIESGSGRRGRIEGMRWGGKTGSADHKKGERAHSWFVGFAPLDKPKIAIAVIAEQFGLGGMLAAPIAGELVKFYLKKGR